ncbi:NapC/NirT cytochrome c domain-containing protein [Thermincola ferriacetica]|uniref:NapC/NirT cytochrome c domain-containing protein n=1 Tax=Thermincola ferriacetica TaxID=281456 RepID=A0A0L6W6D3_9FIRM|nr:cytochrome c nitrite reductase small subunit [Thermincola ferriacetica]KNZ71080.1 NapC/NirT cytochrome c domain-containing protein [Thermincola ferriacetica]
MEKRVSKIIITVGLIVGMMSFLFVVTDAAISYSDNPEFCINCHSMDEAYMTYQHSTHKQFKCTDCHAPHSYLAKVAFKTKSGLRDLYVTTLGEIPPVIKATDKSKEIIKENCIRCHLSTVENTEMGEGRFCSDCHRQLPHKKVEKNI